MCVCLCVSGICFLPQIEDETGCHTAPGTNIYTRDQHLHKSWLLCATGPHGMVGRSLPPLWAGWRKEEKSCLSPGRGNGGREAGEREGRSTAVQAQGPGTSDLAEGVLGHLRVPAPCLIPWEPAIHMSKAVFQGTNKKIPRTLTLDQGAGSPGDGEEFSTNAPALSGPLTPILTEKCSSDFISGHCDIAGPMMGCSRGLAGHPWIAAEGERGPTLPCPAVGWRKGSGSRWKR